jgi:hypothetical protein
LLVLLFVLSTRSAMAFPCPLLRMGGKTLHAALFF